MLNHNERKQLAQDLSSRIVAKYPGQIILAGLYGSTATSSDTPWSDLEMWFFVEDGCLAKSQHLIFRDTAVGYWVYQLREIEELVLQPSIKWPFHMGVLEALEVLYGDSNLPHKLIEAGKAIPAERFRVALESAMPGLVVESYGRIRSCQLRNNWWDVSVMVFEVLSEMLVTLCLLNQRWVRHDYYQGFVDSFEFSKLPHGYIDILPELYKANDIGTIVPLAEKLFVNYWILLEENGIKVNNFQFVEQIPL
jgi:hypothetical protein